MSEDDKRFNRISDSLRVERICGAVKEYDSALLECPIEHPKPGRQSEVMGHCVRCRATSSECCWLDVRESEKLIKRIRGILEE